MAPGAFALRIRDVTAHVWIRLRQIQFAIDRLRESRSDRRSQFDVSRVIELRDSGDVRLPDRRLLMALRTDLSGRQKVVGGLRANRRGSVTTGTLRDHLHMDFVREVRGGSDDRGEEQR
jgi:hypothetical protein